MLIYVNLLYYSIHEEAERRSAIFRDQPETPLDRATFWVEYVIRHKGAPHLRSAVIDLAWYQRHMVDVVAVIIFGIIVITLSLREMWHFYRGSPNPSIRKAKKVQ
jgi:hypothetical protein